MNEWDLTVEWGVTPDMFGLPPKKRISGPPEQIDRILKAISEGKI